MIWVKRIVYGCEVYDNIVYRLSLITIRKTRNVNLEKNNVDQLDKSEEQLRYIYSTSMLLIKL